MPSTPQDHKKASKKTSKKVQTPSPASEAADSKYAANSWLTGGSGTLEDVETPSGQLCLARRPGVEGLMTAGVLQNVDSLSGIVNAKFINKTGEVDAEALMQDDGALADIMHTVDKVVCFIVVKPEVHMTPNDKTRRKQGIVYADMVDLMDKMFLFNYAVGGTKDLESFRTELVSHVGSLAPVQSVPDKTVIPVPDQ